MIASTLGALAPSLLGCALAAFLSAPGGLLFSPTGIGIGGSPINRDGQPTDGKVGDRPGSITALAVSPQGTTLLSGDVNGRLVRYSLEGGKLSAGEKLEWKDGRTQPGGIEAILWTPAGIWVATDEGTLARLEESALVEIARHPEGSRALVVSPDGLLIASAGQSGDLRVFSPKGELVAVIEAHEVCTVALASEPGEGKRLWSLGWDGRICAWAWPKPDARVTPAAPKKAGFRGGKSASKASARKLSKPLLELELGLREPTGLALLPPPEGAKGKDAEPRLYVTDFQGLLRRVDPVRRKLELKSFPTRLNMELLTGACLAPGGERGVAVASAEGNLLFFEPDELAAPPRVLQHYELPPARACFTGPATVAVGFYDGRVELVEVK